MKPTIEILSPVTQATSQAELRMMPLLKTKNPESTFQVSIHLPLKHSNSLLGYGGYVPGVKSENVFGQTYGKTSFQSSAGTFHRGIDEPANIKYQSLFKQEYIHHADKTHETTAQIVGVHRN